MPSSHLVLVILFFPCLLSLPASESFRMSYLFPSGGQSIGASASASVLPMNIRDWFPLGSHISLLSKGLSRVFFNNTVQKPQFFSAQPSYQLYICVRKLVRFLYIWKKTGDIYIYIYKILSKDIHSYPNIVICWGLGSRMDVSRWNYCLNYLILRPVFQVKLNPTKMAGGGSQK